MRQREILIVPPPVWRQMLELARAEAPVEACGLLAGINFFRVERFYPMTNVDLSGEHFSMNPREQLKALKDMRRRNL